MKNIVSLCIILLSINAANSQEQIETTLDLTPGAQENPWTLDYGLSFNTNADSVQESVADPINANQFMQTIGINKKFIIGKLGAAMISTTPTVSAGIISNGAFSEQDFYDNTDYLKSAKVGNTLALEGQYGNTQYGLKLESTYNYGYTYRYRNSDNVAKGETELFRRDNSNLKLKATTSAGVAISKNYVIEGELSAQHSNYYSPMIPAAPFRTAKSSPNFSFTNAIGVEKDFRELVAKINNKLIFNDNFTLELPVQFGNKRYSQIGPESYSAILNGNDEYNKLGFQIKPSYTSDFIDLSASVTFISQDNLSFYELYDSHGTEFASDLTFKMNDQISFNVNYLNERTKYSYPLSESINTYGAKLNLGNSLGINKLDTSLSYSLTDANANYGTGKYENQSASLDLNYKL